MAATAQHPMSEKWDEARRGAFLTPLPLFRELAPAVVSRIAAAIHPRVILRGEAVFLKGEEASAFAIIRLLAGRLRDAEARIRDLQTVQVEQRIANVLLRLARKTGVKAATDIQIGIP